MHEFRTCCGISLWGHNLPPSPPADFFCDGFKTFDRCGEGKRRLDRTSVELVERTRVAEDLCLVV